MPRPGDILLVKGCGPIEKAIEWATSSRFSHAAMLAPSGMLVESYPGVGIRTVPTDSYPDAAWFRVHCLPEQRLSAIEWAATRVGQPYGWRDVAHDWNRPLVGLELTKRLRLAPVDCSSFCAWAYLKAGVTLTRRPYPSPADLSWSVALTEL